MTGSPESLCNGREQERRTVLDVPVFHSLCHRTDYRHPVLHPEPCRLLHDSVCIGGFLPCDYELVSVAGKQGGQHMEILLRQHCPHGEEEFALRPGHRRRYVPVELVQPVIYYIHRLPPQVHMVHEVPFRALGYGHYPVGPVHPPLETDQITWGACL